MSLLPIWHYSISHTLPTTSHLMPGDLNLKKSWNPALVKNQKKVWEREQDALKEYQQIKQRKKEIEQEREKEELIRLQYGNDRSNMPTKQKLELNKLGWMYTDVPKKDDEVNESGFREVEEDFLLNKDDVEQLLKGGRVVEKSNGSRFDQVATVGSQRPDSRLSDDPLLMIKREHVKRRAEGGNGDREERNRERSPERRSRDDRDHHRVSKSGHSSRSGEDGTKSDNSSRYKTSHRSSSHRSSSHNSSSHRSSSHRSSSHRSSSHKSSSHRSSSHSHSSNHRSSHEPSHRSSENSHLSTESIRH